MGRAALRAATVAVGVLWLSAMVAAQEEAALSQPSAIRVRPGDVIWQPTSEQLSRWVENGILAASLDMYLYDLPATMKWMWTSEEGTDLPGGRKLQFVVMMTPELTAITGGYAASWVEETWARIQEDQQPVVEELVRRLLPGFDGRQVYFAVGISGDVFHDASAAVYYDGEWRDVDLSLFGPLEDYLQQEMPAGTLTPRWAAGYLIGQSLNDPAFAASDELRVYTGLWYSLPEKPPSQNLIGQLEIPTGFDKDTIRFVVGTEEQYAYTDFTLGE